MIDHRCVSVKNKATISQRFMNSKNSTHPQKISNTEKFLKYHQVMTVTQSKSIMISNAFFEGIGAFSFIDDDDFTASHEMLRQEADSTRKFSTWKWCDKLKIKLNFSF